MVLDIRHKDQLKETTTELAENAFYWVTDVSKRADMDNLIKGYQKFAQSMFFGTMLELRQSPFLKKD